MANADNRASHALYTRSLEDLNVIDNFLFTELSTNEDVNEEFFRILLSTFLQREFRSCGAEATPEMVYEKAIATR